LRFKCLALLLLVVGFWLTHKPVFAGLYNFLALEIRPRPADALVVEGWVFDSGKALAAALYRKGYARYLITTGGPILRDSACYEHRTWAQAAKHYFVSSGIAESSIISLQTQVRGTRYEAAALGPLLERLGVSSIIIVTQRGHERRSYLAFRKAFGEREIPIFITAADEKWFQAHNWWKSHDGLVFLFTEYMSLLYYWLNDYV
jgi:uncharacterized SAM-binding protein YcdF (DUF218 family)